MISGWDPAITLAIVVAVSVLVSELVSEDDVDSVLVVTAKSEVLVSLNDSLELVSAELISVGAGGGGGDGGGLIPGGAMTTEELMLLGGIDGEPVAKSMLSEVIAGVDAALYVGGLGAAPTTVSNVDAGGGAIAAYGDGCGIGTQRLALQAHWQEQAPAEL